MKLMSFVGLRSSHVVRKLTGQTNISLANRNITIIRGVMNALTPLRSDAILIVVSTPVDLLTSLVQRLSGLPVSQVIGSGTFLDSVHLRGLVADKIQARIQSHNFRALERNTNGFTDCGE
jgi:L-lactate dehydrogenase